MYKPLLSAILFFILSYSQVFADCRGCCSHHGGVVCRDGITQCGDGTPLSAKCAAKGCNKCGSSSGYSKPYTSPSTPPSPSVTNKSIDTTGSDGTRPANAPSSNRIPSLNTQKMQYIITTVNGNEFKTNSYWEEGGKIKFVQLGGVLGYPKDMIQKIEQIPLE